MLTKNHLRLLLIAAFAANTTFAQTGATSGTNSFNEVRKTDFNKLLNLEQNFQGVSLKYDKDKTAILGGGGIPLSHSGTHFLYLNGSVGTSTDLSTLFNQDLLPTFAAGASYNVLLPFWNVTVWKYDGAYAGNYATLAAATTASAAATGSGSFSYRDKILENIKSGKYNAASTVYTFKRLLWLSATAKYNNNKYGFLDTARAFKSQQYDTTFQTFTGQIAFNYYMGWNHTDFKWHPSNFFGYRPQFIFASVYALVNKSNNIGQLKKVTTNDIREVIVDTASNTARQVVTKNQNYYEGKFKEYTTFTGGAKAFISPVKSITLDFFVEYSVIGSDDKNSFGLNNYGSWGTGIYFYTGKNNSSQINIGAAFKRGQNSTNRDWTNKIELVTSVPISAD